MDLRQHTLYKRGAVPKRKRTCRAQARCLGFAQSPSRGDLDKARAGVLRQEVLPSKKHNTVIILEKHQLQMEYYPHQVSLVVGIYQQPSYNHTQLRILSGLINKIFSPYKTYPTTYIHANHISIIYPYPCTVDEPPTDRRFPFFEVEKLLQTWTAGGERRRQRTKSERGATLASDAIHLVLIYGVTSVPSVTAWIARRRVAWI